LPIEKEAESISPPLTALHDIDSKSGPPLQRSRSGTPPKPFDI
jgi:hypothetical protein